MNTIGIDVDSKHLVCHIRRSGKDYPEAIFSNDAAGHRKLIAWATKGRKPARIGMEATGVYSVPLAIELHADTRIEVMVVNPKAIKHFATAILQRGKTDRLDAGTILQFVERMPFQPWQPPAQEVLEIQHISRRIAQLNVELTRERNRREAANRLGRIGQVVVDDTTSNIDQLKCRIAALYSTVRKRIEAVPDLNDKLELLESITGVAKKTGPRILAELEALPDDMTGPQWVASAGLDPRSHDSGTSTHKPRRISKNGNRYLREALYFPALVASRNDPHVKAYYDKLIARAKKPLQAIVAIMRKLLLAIWGMFKNGERWNGEKFYQMA